MSSQFSQLALVIRPPGCCQRPRAERCEAAASGAHLRGAKSSGGFLNHGGTPNYPKIDLFNMVLGMPILGNPQVCKHGYINTMLKSGKRRAALSLGYITTVPHSNPIKSPYIPILLRRNTILSLMSSLKIPEQSQKNRIKSH